jgi:hypothetical protein
MPEGVAEGIGDIGIIVGGAMGVAPTCATWTGAAYAECDACAMPPTAQKAAARAKARVRGVGRVVRRFKVASSEER